MEKTMYAIYSADSVIGTWHGGMPQEDLSGEGAVRGCGDCWQQEAFSTWQEAKERLFAHYKNCVEPIRKNDNLFYALRGYYVEEQIFTRETADDDWEINNHCEIVCDLPTHFEIEDLNEHDVLYETDDTDDAFNKYFYLCDLPENSEKCLGIFANGTKLLG